MKKLRTTALSFLFSIGLCSAQEMYPLDGFIVAINNSVAAATSELASSNIILRSAEINLKTVYDKSGGGGFKIFAKASHQWQAERSSSITFKYARPDDLKQKSMTGLPNFTKVQTQLVNAIKTAAIQFGNVQTVTGLLKEGFSVEISFSLVNTTDGGLEIKLFGIEFDTSGTIEKTAAHSITLDFKSKGEPDISSVKLLSEN